MPGARNHFNCPIVASYPEVVLNNIDGIRHGRVRYANPFLPLHHPKRLKQRLMEELAWAGVTRAEVGAAVDAGCAEQARFKAEVRAKGEETLREVRRRGLRGLILAGRPYHLDPEINHGIAELAVSLGMAVLTEDSVAHLGRIQRPLRVVDQWVYHTRLYAAASLAAEQGRPCTGADQLLRLRPGRGHHGPGPGDPGEARKDPHGHQGGRAIQPGRRAHTPALTQGCAGGAGEESRAPPGKTPRRGRGPYSQSKCGRSYTILAPQMSPIHFRIVEEAFRLSGYRLEILPDVDREAINEGLTSVNNDACFPSILVVGQLMAALRSGRYDLSRTALLMSQTGGGCRATNYIAFIRKALSDAGMGHVPVISMNAMGLERNPGFRVSLPLVARGLMAVIYGDLLMRMLYRVRPYETVPGAAQTALR